jgi:hypothetical protein
MLFLEAINLNLSGDVGVVKLALSWLAQLLLKPQAPFARTERAARNPLSAMLMLRASAGEGAGGSSNRSSS